MASVLILYNKDGLYKSNGWRSYYLFGPVLFDLQLQSVQHVATKHLVPTSFIIAEMFVVNTFNMLTSDW